jgi:hypothetical protein
VLTKFFEPGPGAVRWYEQWVFIPSCGDEAQPEAVVVEGIWMWRDVDTSFDTYCAKSSTTTTATTTVTTTITETIPEFVPLVGYEGGVVGKIYLYHSGITNFVRGFGEGRIVPYCRG